MLNYIDVFNMEGMSYTEYRTLLDELLTEGKTTGVDQSEELVGYAKLNVQRMKRLDKTVMLTEELIRSVKGLNHSVKLLVITEGWCGDAAQILPVFNKIAESFPKKVAIKYILRDQHLTLTDQFLTNGGRAIPIVLVLNEKGDKVTQKWGPRPVELQELLAQWKSETTDMMILHEQLHGWYAKDKTQATQHSIIALFSATADE